MESQSFNPKAVAVMKALAYTENGGKPTDPKAGASGELKSIFQFMPDTWKVYSKQITGKDDIPLTPENESAVVYGKVDKWLKEGYDVNQIASMWNAGEQKPDAYKYNVGRNKQGVPYNTPKYAKKVYDYAKQFGFEGEVPSEQINANQSQTSQADTQNKTESGVIPPFTLKTPKEKLGENKGMIRGVVSP